MPFTHHRRDYSTPQLCHNACPDCACRDLNTPPPPPQPPVPQPSNNPFRMLQTAVNLVLARQVAALVEGSRS